MSQGPTLPTHPIELLTNKGLVEPPWLHKVWAPAMVGGVLCLASCGSNFLLRRPMMSGLQKHAAFAIGGGFLGKYIEDYRTDYFAERDAVYRDYIRLHCDEFPEITHKKYADVFEPWYPIR